ncbi:MAG: DegQ family serine endoprotease [Deltaproteobacteria bacterium]|nr:DegQ family serine endoprotease [Deltaproteobacteria bacterium]
MMRRLDSFSMARRWLVSRVILLLGALLLPLNYSWADNGKLWVDSTSQEPLINLQLPSFAPIIDKLSPAVVNISTEGKETAPNSLRGGQPGFGLPNQPPDSPFEFFFQFPMPPQQPRSFSSLGSGFVIHPDGYIVTNNHVVDKASKIVVRFRDDKTEYDAKLIGKDPKTDLALVKVEAPKKLQSVVLGNSDSLQPGDWVIAIGNPFRLGHTVTVGIVSATSRKVGGPYDDFIQTDASINPGNSGGPLFNANGEVVGVNTAIYSPSVLGSSGFNVGIGFAIPINMVKGIMTQLHSSGKVMRGWLGVLIQPVSSDVAEAMGLSTAEGALVADVVDKSPAMEAGIKRGDVITKYDGRIVTENDDLPLMVADTQINKTVSVEVIRDKKPKIISVKIRELVEQDELDELAQGQESKLGLSVQDITPDLAKGLNLEDTNGVIVSQVVPESAAEKAGLRRGDIVLEVGGKPISSSEEFSKATKDVVSGKPMLLLVKRGDNTIFLTIKVE